MAYANSKGFDQTVHMHSAQSDQSLHCLLRIFIDPEKSIYRIIWQAVDRLLSFTVTVCKYVKQLLA